jgi:hypothetical protein
VYLYTHTCMCDIYNMCVSIYTHIHKYFEILLRIYREGYNVIGDVGEPGGHYDKWNKPDKRKIVYVIYRTF